MMILLRILDDFACASFLLKGRRHSFKNYMCCAKKQNTCAKDQNTAVNKTVGPGVVPVL